MTTAPVTFRAEQNTADGSVLSVVISDLAEGCSLEQLSGDDTLLDVDLNLANIEWLIGALTAAATLSKGD